MSVRYAPIPNPRMESETSIELDAAFDDSDDDFDDSDSPLIHPHPVNTTLTYDFNTPVADWDQPPPGSPPPITSLAVPNSIGNSNGVMPPLTPNLTPHTETSWWRRAITVLPYFGQSRSSARPRIIGGGAVNDGVFSNVSAKPTTSGTRIQQGDSIYIVPEESSSAAPPSYTAAQADAAPPYHTSLVLLPPSAPYDSNALSSPPTQGSVIVDALPTGTLFAFLWNTLVSTTFQFVGFVLTWVMHTTHAAKFGSRAGLGITLIQWGFALRARLDDVMNGATGTWEDGTALTFGSTKEAEDYYYNNLGNTTALTSTTQPIPGQGEIKWNNSLLTGPIATEWLSFFLMTIGWFLLLTSSLGFWRVKRWERSILASHSSPSSRTHARTQSEVADEEESRPQSFLERIGLFRYTRVHSSGLSEGIDDGPDGVLVPTENSTGSAQWTQGMPWYSDPERARRARETIAREQRLCDDLRAAGLL